MAVLLNVGWFYFGLFEPSVKAKILCGEVKNERNGEVLVVLN